MSSPLTKIDRLREMLTLLNDGLTKADFEKSFKAILDLILKIEQELIKKIDSKTAGAKEDLEELKKLHKQIIEKIEEENKSSFSNMKKWAIEQVNALFIKSRLNEKLNLFDDKINEIDDRLASVRDGAVGPQGPLGESGSPDTTQDIVNKLSDKGEDGLHIEDIWKLKDELDEIKAKKVVVGGGGFNYGALDMHIIDSETPTGTPNGILTDFTIVHAPSPVSSLKVFLDGQRMKLTADYTFSGITITFLVAPLTGSLITVDYRI